MKFWKFSSQALATLLSVVTLAQASGPTDGEAAADPNSAVVKLTTATFKTFLDENPLVLAEFFAPWCGYCKLLGPEFSKAADSLNESHPNIKLAQIDCTEEEQLCLEHGIRGYPTLKLARGSEATEDYDGPREADGIVDYMIKQTLPAVQEAATLIAFNELASHETKPYVVQIGSTSETSEIFEKVAKQFRKDHLFLSADKSFVDGLKKKFSGIKNDFKKPTYLVVHPDNDKEPIVFDEELSLEALSEFIKREVVPLFGDINGDTYMTYMASPLPLAYYFYNTKDQRADVAPLFTKLGKEFRGKINFVGLDASLFGKHAETINMNPEITPLFAIHTTSNDKKYGVNQTEFPEGPSQKVIEKFVRDYFADKLSPIIKSQPLPTEEEIASTPVVQLVAHNHDDVVKDVTKDVFVKYYAPWCGHCKKLAPTWEELAELYDSKNADSQVVIANLDHSSNDVTTPVQIEGYPTLLLYPANGEIDEKTGLRTPIVFSDNRELESLIKFIKEKGAHGVDGHELKSRQVEIEEEDEETLVDKVEEVLEEAKEVEHDEL
ncbi:protein disulfide isomerase [Suhomyces tanzawaensis NRRL Y-17324]|uniref:protein disulfide-isomerase n=1 Tax=Suhomyces tanzawaensis NRRL Y-17324 TaxID=984487 RepID=A0A1E4SM69_9ASCO|nr:protein disulfide isomerase [Suhomyces tanzawaensis NRRL Y-17324]ODV80585.1 protein disulfide isomerase [Suhomyces tanzawaensis NRRL Y-17324]